MRAHSGFKFGILLAIACEVIACTPSPFPLIKSTDGWVQLTKPPIEEKEILSIASEDFKSRYFDHANTITWFSKSDIEYLVSLVSG